MVEKLSFTRTAPINQGQLSDEIFSQVGVWVGRWSHEGNTLTCDVAPRDSPLSLTQKTDIENVVMNHAKDPSYGFSDDDLFSNKGLPIVWATLVGADIPNRTVTVRKTVMGRVITKTANVAYGIVRAHQDGNLSIGDIVLVGFVDNDISKPIVLDKVVT